MQIGGIQIMLFGKSISTSLARRTNTDSLSTSSGISLKQILNTFN
jgi:hypothetical protein